MNYDFKLIDNTDLRCRVTSRFMVDTSEDGMVSFPTDSGVAVFKLLAMKDSTLPVFSYTKHTIPPSNYILVEHLNIPLDNIIESLERADVFEVILRTDTSALIRNCRKKNFKSLAAKWSPSGAVGRQSVLTVLTDGGSLDVYTPVIESSGLMKYHNFGNVSAIGIEQQKFERIPINLKAAYKAYEELKQRICACTPTAFTWSHLLTINDATCCLLFVAYMNGKIGIWKFNYVDLENYKDGTIFYISQFQTELINIKAIHWKKSKDGGLLIFGNTDGKVHAVAIANITDVSFETSNPIVLSNGESIAVEQIYSVAWKMHLYVYVFKLEYIYIYLFNSSGECIDSSNFYIGNFNITGFKHTGENNLLVLTTTGVMKELKVSCNNDKIQVNWRFIYINHTWLSSKALGFFISNNNLIFGLLSDASRTYKSKGVKDNMFLTTYFNKALDPMAVIFRETKSLINCYDCFETIRVAGLVTKQVMLDHLPSSIDYGKLTLLQLKSYWFIAKISEIIYDQVEHMGNYSLRPSIEIYLMLEIKLAIYYTRKLLRNRMNKDLNTFQRSALKYLIYYFKEIAMTDLLEKYKFPTTFADEILDIIVRTKHVEFAEPEQCFFCENDLIGTFCMNQHSDNRCAITMVQVRCPKYKCPLCKRCVSEEAVKEYGVETCPFCDAMLNVITDTGTFTAIIAENIESVDVDS